MWKLYCLLSLTLCTFEFSPGGRLAGAELVTMRDNGQNHRKETRGRPEATWDENTAELLGKWRNNGEALEPKWRDGDTIPLLPFSQFSRFTSGKIDNSDEEQENDDDRRTPKYRQSNRRENFLRTRNNLRRLPYNDYDDRGPTTEIKRINQEPRDEISQRKRNRAWNSENAATLERIGNDDENRDIRDDRVETSARHREIFESRPNDYEHELNDEEYLKPRPRKRRPPQNYEFTLVENETKSSNEGDERNNNNNKSGPRSRANNEENHREIATTKSAPFLHRNAVELKSLLKMQQDEGSSLSEILQRRNLTLNDLLNGKADVINALRMRDNADESQDYEETARMTTTDSFAKPFTVNERPRWTFTTARSPSGKSKNSPNDELVINPIVPASTSLRNSQSESSSKVNKDGEAYSVVVSATTGKPIHADVDDATRVAITTPSMPLPVATSSMEELMQADDAGTKSPDLGSAEIRAESFDEDEIMEFSDFTDYKNGRNGVSPVWLMMKENGDAGETPKSASSVHRFEDKGSTLSIEKILHPTERSKLTRFPASPGNQGQGLNDSDSVNRGRTFKEEEQREKDYDSSSEKEYQSDTPDTVMYYDLERSTRIGNFTSGESDTSRNIMKELESALDAMSRDVDATLENRRAHSKSPLAQMNDSDNPKNHQNRNTTGKKSYDDIISEVEPEARAEIFELFASGSAGKRLERLLKSRNMSLEELIALRQRGSSKVHLADVSRIRAHKSNGEHRVKNTDFKATGSSSSSKEGKATANRENYDRAADNYLSQTTENLKTIDSTSSSMDLVRLDDDATERLLPKLESKISDEDIALNTSPRMDTEKDERERHRTVEIVDLLTTFDSFPFIKDIQREFTNQYDKDDKRKLLVQGGNVGVMFVNNVNDTSNVVESGYVKEIVKHGPSSIDIQAVSGKTGDNNILDEDESRSKKGKSLSKVKPSIIASGAILGVTLVVFLAIFIVCRIRQKQKYRYKNTFSRAVFQGPVMTARKLSNSSSLSTVMVNVVATSTTKRPERNENQSEPTEMDSKSDIDNDSLDANDSWETIPDYMK